MASMPEGLKKMLPHAELDLAATIAANTPGAAAVPTDAFCPADPHLPGAAPGVHDGVTCDKSGMCPIVGNRYHLTGHNYDLCEAEYMKLDAKEQAHFRKIPPPAGAAPTPQGAAAAAAGASTANKNPTHHFNPAAKFFEAAAKAGAAA